MLVGILFLGACSLNPTPKFKGIVIPLYVYPTSPEYSKIESTKFSKEVFIVLNPINGPGIVRDSNYYSKIVDLKTKGFRILGYVYTSYASRSLHEVTNDIKAWFSLYPHIDGIFFDEVSGRVEDVSFYSQSASYTRKERVNAKVVFNPGRFPDTSDYFNIADINIVAEMPQDKFLGEWKKLYDVPSTRTGVLIYNVSEYRKVFDKAVLENIGYIYITHEEVNNWREVSKYLSDLASEE